MSFLSRRPSRPGSRDGDAGRDDEYGDYDYAPDGYGGDEDESWSPGEYFSPDGIRGRRADGQRSDRQDPRGRRGDVARGDARGDSGQGYEDAPGDGYNGYGPGGGYGYSADEYATGAYDLPEGSDEEPAERGGRRRKDRGERTGVFRLRRDRGEDIWPDDGISDEDYWASVASDRPLTGPGSPHESDHRAAADSRPMGRPGADGGSRLPAAGGDDLRAAAGSRFGDEQRFGDDQRFADEQRGVTGRLGPPPGLRGDYLPGAPGPARPGTGPQTAARPGTGPLAARSGTGPQAVRPGAAGSAAAWSSQAGFAQSGTGQASYRPSGPQASYQPGGLAGRPQDSRDSDSRPADRGADWGERTERIERVNAAGYPEPRGSSRSQGASRPGSARTSGPLGAPVGSSSFGTAASVGRGSVNGSSVNGGGSGGGRGDGVWADSGRLDGAERRTPERRAPERWSPGRDAERDNVRDSGGWPIPARGGAPADRAGDDDPLTSRAYSRAAVSDADGRSYRVAARRSQAQAKLTEEPTATFTAAAGYSADRYRAGQYESDATEAYPAGQYQTGATGEYPTAQRRAGAASPARAGQYQTGEYGQYQADPQTPTGRQPGYSGQSSPSGQTGAHAGLGQSSQPTRRGHSASAGSSGLSSANGAAGLARPSGPGVTYTPTGFGRPTGSGGPTGSTGLGAAGRPSGPNATAGPSAGNSGRVTLPAGAESHSGPYPTQSASSPQQSRPQPRPYAEPARHAAPSHLPAGGSRNPAASASPAGVSPARTSSAATGQNPYESAVTGSYPYPGQPYPSATTPSAANLRPAPANPALDGRDGHDGRDARDGRQYRPGQQTGDGYGPANVDYGLPGYGTSRDGRR